MSEETPPKEKDHALIQKVKDLPLRTKIIAGASLGVLLLVSIFLICSIIALNNWDKEADRLIEHEIHKISNDLYCSMPEIYETLGERGGIAKGADFSLKDQCDKEYVLNFTVTTNTRPVFLTALFDDPPKIESIKFADDEQKGYYELYSARKKIEPAVEAELHRAFPRISTILVNSATFMGTHWKGTVQFFIHDRSGNIYDGNVDFEVRKYGDDLKVYLK